MSLGRVSDGDSLFRHCIHPLSFNKKATIFAFERMWYLPLGPDGAFHGSLAWERYVPTTEYVHGYGCRLASGINDRKLATGNYKGKDRHYYCGAYQLSGRAIRELTAMPGLGEIASSDVVHLIEEAGEIAHADLRIFLKPGANVEGTKTAILDRLWNSCSGPLRHICACDMDIVGHKSSDLNLAPLGDYHVRPWWFRNWFVVRYHVCNWIWQNSMQHAVAVPDAQFSFRRGWLDIKTRICGWVWRIVSSPD
jgi:hypothetical protein